MVVAKLYAFNRALAFRDAAFLYRRSIDRLAQTFGFAGKDFR